MKRRPKHPPRHREIDVALAVAVRHIEPGVCLTHQDIAEICGCSKRAIQFIERNAMRAIREKFGNLLS